MSPHDARTIVQTMSKYPDIWTDHMMHVELHLDVGKLIRVNTTEIIDDPKDKKKSKDKDKTKKKRFEKQKINYNRSSLYGETTFTASILNQSWQSPERRAVYYILLKHAMSASLAFLLLGLAPLLGLVFVHRFHRERQKMLQLMILQKSKKIDDEADPTGSRDTHGGSQSGSIREAALDFAQSGMIRTMWICYMILILVTFFVLGILIGNLAGALNSFYLGFEYLAIGVLTSVLTFITSVIGGLQSGTSGSRQVMESIIRGSSINNDGVGEKWPTPNDDDDESIIQSPNPSPDDVLAGEKSKKEALLAVPESLSPRKRRTGSLVKKSSREGMREIDTGDLISKVAFQNRRDESTLSNLSCTSDDMPFTPIRGSPMNEKATTTIAAGSKKNSAASDSKSKAALHTPQTVSEKSSKPSTWLASKHWTFLYPDATIGKGKKYNKISIFKSNFFKMLIVLWIGFFIAAIVAHLIAPYYLEVMWISLATCCCTGLGCVPFFFITKISKRTLAYCNVFAAGMMAAASWNLVAEANEDWAKMNNEKNSNSNAGIIGGGFFGSGSSSKAINTDTEFPFSDVHGYLANSYRSYVKEPIKDGLNSISETSYFETIREKEEYIILKTCTSTSGTLTPVVEAMNDILDRIILPIIPDLISYFLPSRIRISDISTDRCKSSYRSYRNYFFECFEFFDDDRALWGVLSGIIFIVFTDLFGGEDPHDLLIEMAQEGAEQKNPNLHPVPSSSTETDDHETHSNSELDASSTGDQLTGVASGGDQLSKSVSQMSQGSNLSSYSSISNPHPGSGKALALFLAMFFHSFAEGVAIGVSFSPERNQSTGEKNIAEGSLGWFISLALACHNVPEGLVIGIVLCGSSIAVDSDEEGDSEEKVVEKANNKPTIKAWQACLLAILSSIPQPIMALIACICVNWFTSIVPYGLCFAAGAMYHVSYFSLWTYTHKTQCFMRIEWLKFDDYVPARITKKSLGFVPFLGRLVSRD